MSQQEKKSWQEAMKQIVGETVDEKLKSWTPPSPPSSPSEHKHNHWKAEDVLNEHCPECVAETEKIVQHWLKGKKLARCIGENCGLVVDVEKDKCPNCGGTEYKELSE